MRDFFGSNGPFVKYGTILADLVILTVIWSICSIPVITIGTSTAALYYVTTRQISNREGYVSSDFFKSFKSNLFQGIISTIIIVVFLAIIYISRKSLFTIEGNLRFYLSGLQLVIAIEILITALYLYPLMSRFEMPLFELFKTALFMANKHLFTTITCLFLFVALVALSFLINPIFLIVGTGMYSYITSHMFMRIFRKYCPDIDVDTFEDKR